MRLPYQDHLSALIHEPSFRDAARDAIFTKARLIKDLGNLAVHSTRKILPGDAVLATRDSRSKGVSLWKATGHRHFKCT